MNLDDKIIAAVLDVAVEWTKVRAANNEGSPNKKAVFLPVLRSAVLL